MLTLMIRMTVVLWFQRSECYELKDLLYIVDFTQLWKDTECKSRRQGLEDQLH